MAQVSGENHNQLIERLVDGFDAFRQRVEVLTKRKLELERMLRDANISYSESLDGGTNEDETIAKGIEAVDLYKSLDKTRGKRQLDRDRNIAKDNEKDDAVVPPGHPLVDSTVSTTYRCPFASLSDANLANLQNSNQSLSKNGHHCPVAPPSPPATQRIPSPMPVTAPEARSLSPSLPPEDRSESRACLPPSRCPIRFLDTLTPEQLSNYFSTHRHEIPRSHEICVRRYRNTDEAKLREMDEKYGGREGATGLGGMIKGLGVMHRGLLPEDIGKEASEKGESHSQSEEHRTSPHGENVKKWADGVSQATQDRDNQPITTNATPVAQPTQTSDKLEDSRDSHFDRDRPLRDVRVGESPSRPWGISVPADTYDTTSQQQQQHSSKNKKSKKRRDRREVDITGEGSFISSRNRSTAIPSSPPCSDIPISSINDPNGQGVIDRGSGDKASSSSSNSGDSTSVPLSMRPAPQGHVGQNKKKGQMLFTGPVFFGYTPEQAVMLLKEMENGGSRGT